MNKININYYENYDNQKMQLDRHNPRYVLSLPSVDDILYFVATNEFKKNTKEEIIKELQCNESIIDDLIEIGVLSIEDKGLKMACPFFLEKDIILLQKSLDNISSTLANKLIADKSSVYAFTNNFSNGHPVKDNLYHIICGMIFGIFFFDQLEGDGLIRTQKTLNNNHEYMMVLYENTPLVRKLSHELLCSYNCYGNSIGAFESFGDKNGERLDFYSFIRQLGLEKVNPNYKTLLEVYNTLADKEHFKDNLVTAFINYYKGRSIDDKYKKILELTGYIKNNGINIEVFFAKDEIEIAKVYGEIKSLLLEDIKKYLMEIQNSISFSMSAHNVDKLAIAYELCYLIFGSINEKIVRASFVAMPPYFDGQGRYRKMFRLFQSI